MTNKTKIQIQMEPELYQNEDVLNLFNSCSKDEGTLLPIYHEQLDEKSLYDLYFDNTHSANNFISELFSFLDNQEERVFNYKDFYITAYNQDTINHVNVMLYDQLQQDVNILDAVCSEITEEQVKTNERVAAIENYLSSSGIIYYQQFMKELLTILENEELLDKDSIINKMFQQLH